MSAILKLKQARNAEELAQEIEPLAQALASLADETRAVLIEQQEASQVHSQQWMESQSKIADKWTAAASDMREAVKHMDNATLKAQKALQYHSMSMALLLVMVGVGSAALTTGFWLYLFPPEITNTLDAKAVAEFLKPEIIKELKSK